MEAREVAGAADVRALVEARGMSHVKVGVFDVDGVLRGKYMRREKLGRDNYIFLTEAGRALFSTIMPTHDKFVKEILTSLTKEEVQQFAAILRKLDRGLD